MKKIVSALLITLFLLPALVLVEYRLPVNAQYTAVSQHRTWDVDVNGTIQGAINNATAGDTIFVHAGLYSESVVVNKSLSIVGQDRVLTVVDGQVVDYVFYVTADNVTIANFTITKGDARIPDAGIRATSSSNNITHNTITGAFNGIFLFSSSNNIVSDNSISSSSPDGINLFSSSNNMISDNVVSSCSNDGISLSFSSGNVISGNTFTDNFEGVSLSLSSNNVFFGNTFLGNFLGVSVAPSSNNNTYYHNNFYDGVQILSGLVNFWDYGGEGNYWSNFAGHDLNGDGISNVPYVIDVGNRDNYPLMGALSSFHVIFAQVTYDLTLISNSTVSDFRFEIGWETGNRIVRFNVTGQGGSVGFSRILIPTELMNDSLIVLVGEEEIVPTLLNNSNSATALLYFTYFHSSQTVRIISSKALNLYDALLEKFLRLNATYYELLNNYTARLQIDLDNLNTTYNVLLGNYTTLLSNYNQLQQSFLELNASYHQHLLDYNQSLQNLQSLTYIFAAVTAVFIVTTVYVSRQIHVRKNKAIEERK